MQMHIYQDGRTFPEDISMFDGTCMIKYLEERKEALAYIVPQG